MSAYHIKSMRCENWTDERIACGPVSLTSVVVEAVLDVTPDKDLYLIGSWNDSASDSLDFELFSQSMINRFVRAHGEDIE